MHIFETEKTQFFFYPWQINASQTPFINVYKIFRRLENTATD